MKPGHADIEFYGIRHHGPGSARALLQALQLRPADVVLIEAPADTQTLLQLANQKTMHPPIAMLVYNPKQLDQASFLPFAEFSPEWQAIQWGFDNQITLRFIDLPLSHSFALRENDALAPPIFSAADQRDPFVEIAALGGYDDPERWWEAMFESSKPEDHPESAFEAVSELMHTLRASKHIPESRETLLREAWMRQAIRQAIKDGFKSIAVVCGAWHVPALTTYAHITAASDSALLRGLKKNNTACTWIPWSFDRLASTSGYRSGVLAPAWYQIIWDAGKTGRMASAEWMAQTARALRNEGMESATANVIEGIRLAEALATLRHTRQAGIETLREAAVSALFEGNTDILKLIDRIMVVGDKFGSVPDNLPLAPLKSDFEAQIKRLRLKKSSAETPLLLDLRESNHLEKSKLLHRLAIVGVHWGKTQSLPEGRQGSFHEIWALKWQPEFEIGLIIAGQWGNTIAVASEQHLFRKVQQSQMLPELSALIQQVLKADLPSVLPNLLDKIRDQSALAADALLLADSVLPLVQALRYGNARSLNMEALESILSQTIPRTCVLLPDACRSINESAAATVLRSLLQFNHAIGILENSEFESAWQKTLLMIQGTAEANALLSGFSSRLLFDKQSSSLESVRELLYFKLSAGQEVAHAAAWLEGFLHGSGLLLLHHPSLLETLDHWIQQVPDDRLVEILPILRRTFARYSAPEKENMLKMLAHPVLESRSDELNAQQSWDKHRSETVVQLLNQILGKR